MFALSILVFVMICDKCVHLEIFARLIIINRCIKLQVFSKVSNNIIALIRLTDGYF